MRDLNGGYFRSEKKAQIRRGVDEGHQREYEVWGES